MTLLVISCSCPRSSALALYVSAGHDAGSNRTCPADRPRFEIAKLYRLAHFLLGP